MEVARIGDVEPWQTSSQKVTTDIQSKILDGDYSPGLKLPTERDLAAHYEVNRHVVREALKRLSEQGLVDVRRGSGTYVMDLRETGGIELLVPVLHRYPGMINLKNLRQYLEYRRDLFGCMASLAAVRRTDDDLQEFGNAVTTRAKCRSDIDQVNDANAHLYKIVARCTKNIMYELMTNTLNRLLHRLKEPIPESEKDSRAMQESWEQLLDAFRRSDPDLARAWAKRQSDCLESFVEAYWSKREASHRD